jgi:uncharacterized membrane protein (DUF485 family)
MLEKLSRVDLYLSVILAATVAVFGLLSLDKQAIFSNDVNLCGIYCQMATHYGDMLLGQSFDKYYFQKSLISFLTFLVMEVGGIEKTPIHANYINEIISAFLLCGSAVIWFLIAQKNEFSRSAFWLGAIGMLSCQLFVKLVPYAQDSPDTAAFFLGMAALYAVTCHRSNWILPIYIAALFTQPQLKIFLAPVFILSYTNITKISASHFIYKISEYISFVSDKCSRMKWEGAVFIFAVYIVLLTIVAFVFPYIIQPMHGTANSLPILFPISICLSGMFFSYILTKLKIFSIISNVAHKFSDCEFWKKLGVIVVIEITTIIFISYLAQGEVMSATSSLKGAAWTFVSFYYQSIEQPLKFLFAPIMFYGPLFVLILLSFNKLTANLSSLPDHLAISCALVLFIFLFPNTESRHFIAYIPWLAFLSLKRRDFSICYLAIFTFFTVIASRFYATYASLDYAHDPYILTWGPWYTTTIYWHSAAYSIIALAIFWYCNKKWERFNGN